MRTILLYFGNTGLLYYELYGVLSWCTLLPTSIEVSFSERGQILGGIFGRLFSVSMDTLNVVDIIFSFTGTKKADK